MEARKLMADPESPQGKLYTLSEVAQKTKISMPTLQRYKKLYQDRIPAEGKGRKQRYPDSALPVFDQIRKENLGRRGRPRKDPNAPRPVKSAGRPRGRAAAIKAGAARLAGRRRGRPPGRPPATAAPAPVRGRGGRKPAGSGQNLLTLTQISKDTGISYPTLVRYVRLHGDRLPHEGRGRGRRFYPEARDVFRQLRSESGRGGRKPGKRRGRPPGSGRAAAAAATAPAVAVDAGLHQRLKAVEKSQEKLDKKLKGFAKSLQRLLR